MLPRTVSIAAVALFLAFSGLTLSVASQGVPVDAYTYFAAGERLNVGHDLYRLGPGDRPILVRETIDGAPLLSPPPLAVVWRVLSPLGASVTVVWAALSALAYLVTVAWMIWRFWPTALALLPFLDGVAWTVSLGNVNGFLAAGMLGVWKLRARPWLVGPLAVTLAVLKLSPAPLVLWSSRDRRTWLPMALTAIGWLAACALLAPGAVGEYLGLVHASGGPSWLVVVVGGAATLLLPQRYAFAAAVWTGLLASPVNGPYWFAIGVAAFAPWTDQPGPADARHANGEDQQQAPDRPRRRAFVPVASAVLLCCGAAQERFRVMMVAVGPLSPALQPSLPQRAVGRWGPRSGGVAGRG